MNIDQIKGFLNDDGKLAIWPAKPGKRFAVLQYLASKFEDDKKYSEKEINEIIKDHCEYNDYVLLRRELFGHKLLDRTIDGRSYWKI